MLFNLGDKGSEGGFCSLAGKLLLASPYANLNEVFNKTAIYVIHHGKKGAFGLIVNRPTTRVAAKTLLRSLRDPQCPNVDFDVYYGGPVENERGFILHDSDYKSDHLLEHNGCISVSTNMQVLEHTVYGRGPKNLMLVMGYTGWNAGQLEEELNQHLWIVSDCDERSIFTANKENKWNALVAKTGLKLNLFSSIYGHA